MEAPKTKVCCRTWIVDVKMLGGIVPAGRRRHVVAVPWWSRVGITCRWTECCFQQASHINQLPGQRVKPYL